MGRLLLSLTHHPGTDRPICIEEPSPLKNIKIYKNGLGTWKSKVYLLDHRYSIPITLRRAIHELFQCRADRTDSFGVTHSHFDVIGITIVLTVDGKT